MPGVVLHQHHPPPSPLRLGPESGPPSSRHTPAFSPAPSPLLTIPALPAGDSHVGQPDRYHWDAPANATLPGVIQKIPKLLGTAKKDNKADKKDTRIDAGTPFFHPTVWWLQFLRWPGFFGSGKPAHEDSTVAVAALPSAD